MRKFSVLLAAALLAVGCGDNVVSSNPSGSTSGSSTSTGGDSGSSGSTGATAGTDSGSTGGDSTGSTGATSAGDSGSSGGTTGSTDPRATYPAGGGHGVAIGQVMSNVQVTGYLNTSSGVQIDTNSPWAPFDLEAVRMLTDANGNHFRYMLLDLGAGWCVPCNNEGDQYGLNGADSAKIAQWLSKGGLYVQVLVQDHGSGGIPTQADVTQWLSDHATQSPLAADIAGSIQHIVPQSAFPANLVINLDTMQILDAWYGVDDNKISSSWEARLNQ